MDRVIAWAVPKVVALVSLVVVYGVVNVAAVGGQKLWHHTDQARLDHIKVLLAAERDTVLHIQSEMKDMATRQFPAVEASGDSSLMVQASRIYLAYEAAESLHVARHNALADTARMLIKAIGGTWYVVPVPGGRGRSHAE